MSLLSCIFAITLLTWNSRLAINHHYSKEAGMPSQDVAAAKTVAISVNTKPVQVPGPRTTGWEIKEAAIAQGVQIELSFQLSVQRGPRHMDIIGDNETITVHKGLTFVAVAGDD